MSVCKSNILTFLSSAECEGERWNLGSKLEDRGYSERKGLRMPSRSSFSGKEFLILVFLVLTSLTGNAINPGCRCVRFVSTFGKEWGTFESPNFSSQAIDFPRDAPRENSQCILYIFTSPTDFIIQINFTRIQLPITTNPNSGFLKLFLHLSSDGVNESTPWNLLIRGDRRDETYYSASRHLVIQFHTGSSPSPQVNSGPFGFHGFFRFLNSSQFESNGRLVAGTKCDYTFESSNYSSPEGKFFSPYYPSNYNSHNVMCAYMFRARLHERVKLIFKTVELEPGVYSCLNKSDVIRVFDGATFRSPVIALICNDVTDYEILSSGQELLVQFIGNSDSAGKGFRAKFHFIKVIIEDPYDISRFNLQLYFPKLDIPKPIGEDGQPQASTLVPQCDTVIYSDTGRNGSLSSPSYPNPYQPKSHCRFDLIGHGRQRAQISFVDFHLFHTDEKILLPRTLNNNFSEEGRNNDAKCAYSDTISVFIEINGERVNILEHCGINPPPDIMSNDHRMTLEFNAKASTTTPPFRGFYAHYAFVEDFGVKSGLQASTDYPCAFIFHISSHSNGTISSPNYPGLVPRATECHYFFHGNEEKGCVEVFFDQFDITGAYPCNSEDSDYLEFSNFMPTDSRYDRRCGRHQTNVAIAGGGKEGFFRLTFRSNDGSGDGGIGFQAFYRFTSKINHINSRTSTAPSGNVISDRGIASQILLFLLGLTVSSVLELR